MKTLSIQMRVTLWLTLVLAGVVCALLICVNVLGRRSVWYYARDIMAQIVADRFAHLQYLDGVLESDDEAEDVIRNVYLTVYDDEETLQGGRIPPGFDIYACALSAGFRTVSGEDDSWYLYDESRMVEPGREAWVRGVLSVSGEMRTVSSMIHLTLILFPLFAVLAAVVGYLLVVRAFRPIRLITESASQIVDGTGLTRRVDLGEGKDEISRLAATFDAMLGRLHASFERERQFAADVSHELRTPTTVMISQCEYALEHARTLQEAKDALSSVLAQAERMSALISQLLVLSRIRHSGENLNRERINLSELAELVAAQMEESAAKRQISIHTHIEPDLILEGDETQLMRLLLNLMENGIQYGRQGGWLVLTLRRQGESIVGTVEDNGIGIAADRVDRIWDRLYQVDPARSSGGMGLGLSMVKYIVSAHGGSISVKSRPGEGSTFTFTLPTA